MNISFVFIRFLYTALSVFVFTTAAALSWNGFTPVNIGIGFAAGIGFSALLLASETYFKRTNLRAFNTAVLGLFFGYFLAQAIITIFSGVLELGSFVIQPEINTLIKVAVYLFATYAGVIFTLRAAEEIHISLPFVKFQPTTQKKKDILIDSSLLLDSRVIDLASSGLVNNLLVLPRFIFKELSEMAEDSNEANKSKARRALEVVKKLQSIQDLNLRFIETDFPEIKDSTAKFVRLARLNDASILTADISRIEQSSIEGITVINIHMLANSLKPLTQTGEYINIKVQRYGKEARQGVGYLDDGTMVVINGGAEFIGETIKAQVLSVKHTSSGRMIFCNAFEDGMYPEDDDDVPHMEGSAKNYFAL